VARGRSGPAGETTNPLGQDWLALIIALAGYTRFPPVDCRKLPPAQAVSTGTNVAFMISCGKTEDPALQSYPIALDALCMSISPAELCYARNGRICLYRVAKVGVGASQ
jgi:hypothetical protein